LSGEHQYVKMKLISGVFNLFVTFTILHYEHWCILSMSFL